MARTGSVGVGPAVALLSQISNRLHRANAICGIAQGLVRAGDLEQARHLASAASELAQQDFDWWQYEGQQMHILPGNFTAMAHESAEADQQRVSALSLLARTLALVDAGEQAAAVADRARAVAARISGRALRAAALCVVAETASTLRRAEEVKAAIADATSAALDVEDLEPRALALARIARTLQAVSRQDDALAMLIDAFDVMLAARRYQRADAFALFRETIPVIAAIERGEVLWTTGQALMDVELWWE
jgi:hypothetical protein